MATTGVVNSTLMVIKVGSSTVACLTDASLSMTQESRDTTCKDSSSWTNVLAAKRSWEVSGTGLFAYDATYGGKDLATLFIGGQSTLSTIKWGTTVSGDTIYSGTALLTSLSLNGAGTDENTTFEFTFQGVGALAASTNP